MEITKRFARVAATITLAAIGLLTFCLAPVAQAQLGFDTYSTVRALPIGTPQFLFNATGPVTNGPVDIIGFYGRSDLLVTCGTNGGGTLTLTVQSSSDSTNWTSIANFALINSTTAQAFTNTYYGSTNLIVTNNYVLPYTVTTPTAASAGFFTPYPAYIPFTNAAGAITVTAAGTYIVGINLTDNPRYLHVIWTPTGAATNNTFVTATLLGPRSF
jgi:hypothetical protein